MLWQSGLSYIWWEIWEACFASKAHGHLLEIPSQGSHHSCNACSHPTFRTEWPLFYPSRLELSHAPEKVEANYLYLLIRTFVNVLFIIASKIIKFWHLKEKFHRKSGKYNAMMTNISHKRHYVIWIRYHLIAPYI